MKRAIHPPACWRPFEAARLPAVLGLMFCFLDSSLLATDYYWDADAETTTATGGTGSWDNATALWRLGSNTGTLMTFPIYGDQNADAFFGGAAGTLTLTTGIFVNDINVAPSPTGIYTITGASQTLTLNGADQSLIDVDGGSTLSITSGLAGVNGFTKSSAGTLVLDSAAGTANLTGAISINGGTVRVGSSTLADPADNQVLRANPVNIASGATLTTGSQASGTGATADLRVGQLSGSGNVTPGTVGSTGGAINVLALGDAIFSGAITTNGGLNLRGGNGTTQTFNGNVTALTGTVAVNSGATLGLSGTGDNTSGVIGASTIALRGGSFTLDNTAGNTTAANGRLSDGTAFTFLAGTVSLIGNAAGTSETVGGTTFNSGSNVISVTNNGGAGTQLTFTDSGSLRDQTRFTVNFVGNGGTLGATGANPRISFTGALFANTTNGMLANSSSATAQTTGWAVVNGTSWAGANASNSIIALTDTARNSATLSSAASQELVGFAPSATTTTLSASLGTSATVGIGALKISPTAAGQTLAVSTNSIFSPALMLTGVTDFSITGTTGGLQIGSGTRYVWVTEAGTALNYSAAFPSTGPINKSGPGILNLNATSSQLPAVNVNLLDGVLRGTTASLGGSASTNSANTVINFRGGVLELSGGGTYTRALSITPDTGGGIINWDSSSTYRGDGGFSAIGGEGVFTLVTAAGGAVAATPTWNDGVFASNGYALLFGSSKSDSRVVLTNNFGLDNTTTNGGAANAYFAREIRVATGVTGSSARLNGVISGSVNADLLKTGFGILELTGTSTFAGNTLIQQGTLQVGAAGGTGAGNGQLANTGKIIVNTGGTLLLGGTTASTDRINNNAGLVLSGGTVNTGGLSEGSVAGGVPTAGFGALSLKANSVLDLGNGASILAFANSSAHAWAGTLSIYNYSGAAAGNGTDQLYFGGDTSSLTAAQLGQISFYSGGSGSAFLGTGGYGPDLDGEIVPVPEPATVLSGFLMVGALGWGQRRRMQGWFDAWRSQTVA